MTEKLEYGKVYNLNLPKRTIQALYIGQFIDDTLPFNKDTLSRQYRDNYMFSRVILTRSDNKVEAHKFKFFTLINSQLEPDSGFFETLELSNSEEEYASWLLEKRGLK